MLLLSQKPIELRLAISRCRCALRAHMPPADEDLEQLLSLAEQLLGQAFPPGTASIPPGLPSDPDLSLKPGERLFVSRFFEQVDRHLSNPDLSVPQLCRLLAVSHSRLNRRLSALLGSSAGQLIRRRRLQYASRLLCSTTWTIAEVAYAVGFNDPDYFSRTFAREYDCPPSAYRQTENEPA